ncbi:hypothetical protein RJ639_022843 [Escallonia herrerae]|uniref:NB-ARC domain-containing protein n=1 Tax=Escallonia herrerae TaxID=1293975 RepID=A0AA88V3T4_9ASTE|nr:hypothetical protein RJ639_022843 [Escallonia herrerae]
MEILSSLVQSIGERITNVLVTTLKGEVVYLVHYEETFRNIQEELDDLEDKGKRVQERVDIARNNAEDIEEDVWRWLTKVHGVKEEVNAFLEGKHDVYTSCFRLRRPDFGSRRRLGREAKKKIELIIRVIEDGDFDAISHCAPIEDIGLPSVADYENFGSRQHVFNEIIEALRDDAIKVVGTCGMPGVGKSKMVGKIGEHVMKEMLLHEVMMAVVSANEDVKKIQANLAVRLGLNLSGEETESGRADLLEKRLRNGRKHLVILDDVWNKLQLRSIIGFDVKEDFKGCKILSTSRSQAVLHANECQRPFLIELLKKEEAWDLFKKTLNCVGNLDILPLMEKVCEECGCLPLVIRAVGAALKDKDKSAWEDALECFRNSAPQNISGVYRKMYPLLKLSYDQLEPDEAKSCLLICSLFGEDADISIDDLLRHAKAMGFLEHVRTLEQARNRVLSLVDTLRTSCLLLKGTEDNSVKMYDVIRGVAVSIASEDKKHAFVVKDGVLEWPDIDDTYRATKVMSIRSENFGKIPDKLDCPDLHTLLFECSSSGELKVPNTFFSRLEKLRVLNLSGISTMSLQWVPNLANLLTQGVRET